MAKSISKLLGWSGFLSLALPVLAAFAFSNPKFGYLGVILLAVGVAFALFTSSRVYLLLRQSNVGSVASGFALLGAAAPLTILFFVLLV